MHDNGHTADAIRAAIAAEIAGPNRDTTVRALQDAYVRATSADCGCPPLADHAAGCDGNHYPHDACSPALVFLDSRTYNATATVTLDGIAESADRWTAVEALAYAAGWRMLGWRTYALGDAPGEHRYRCVVDLYRTADDVRSGALQVEAPMR